VPEGGPVRLAIRRDQTPARAAAGMRSEVAGAPPERAQPVFTRYWLHGKGPAPAGNMPVAVHLSPSRLVVQPGDSATVRLTVACGPTTASGNILADVP